MLNLFNDLRHRPAPVVIAKQESLGAEVAAERAAPRRDDGESPEWTIPPQVQQVVPGRAQAGQAGKQLGSVEPAESSVKGILQHLGPNAFGLADANRIAMLARLFRVEESVRAAQDDRHPATAELVGDVVGAKRIESPRGNRSEEHT